MRRYDIMRYEIFLFFLWNFEILLTHFNTYRDLVARTKFCQTRSIGSPEAFFQFPLKCFQQHLPFRFQNKTHCTCKKTLNLVILAVMWRLFRFPTWIKVLLGGLEIELTNPKSTLTSLVESYQQVSKYWLCWPKRTHVLTQTNTLIKGPAYITSWWFIPRSSNHAHNCFLAFEEDTRGKGNPQSIPFLPLEKKALLCQSSLGKSPSLKA